MDRQMDRETVKSVSDNVTMNPRAVSKELKAQKAL